MQKIEIANFKGYHDKVEILLEGKNLLLFGENGAGKTSLYEALRHFFFWSRIEAELVPSTATEEDRGQTLNDYESRLRYAGEPQPSFLLINSLTKDVFPHNDYRVFLISPKELRTVDEIQIGAMISGWFFDGNPSSVLDELWKDLQDEVNKVLSEEFREDISITIDKASGYRVTVNDTRTTRMHWRDLTKHFNESRLHLVQLLIMLELIHLLYEARKKNIIVLDDFVTSLDAANRAFIIRYVLKHFIQFQIVVMTHSAGFYDMFRYEAGLLQSGTWKCGCVYGAEKMCKYYDDKKDIDLKVDVSAVSDADPITLRDAGNKIRRNFEILVHRLSRKLSVGALEESNRVLSKLENSPTLYRIGDAGADRILDQMMSLASCDQYKDTELGKKIVEKLNRCKIDLSQLQEFLIQMELFKKVALHPSSHATAGTGGASPVHKKELEESARILSELITLSESIEVHEESLF